MYGCGESIILPDEGQAAHIAIVSGDAQAGLVGGMLAQELMVRVTDSRDRPVENQEVVFSTDAGAGEVAPATGLTNADGQASANWQLGPGSGTQRLRAQAAGDGVPAELAVTFTATALAGTGAFLEMVSGDDQTGSVGSPLAEPLVVRVRDGDGNPVPNVEVNWTVTGGGGTIEPTPVATDAEGLASAQRILGASTGDQSAQAEVGGLAGSPITFTHTGTATTATRLGFLQEPLNSPAATSIAPAVKVAVLDDLGNIVTSASTPITVALGANPAAGILSGTLTVNATAGVATFSNLSIDKVGNGYELVASGGDFAPITSALFDIASGSGNRLVITSQPSDQVVGGNISPAIQVTVQDAAGNTVTSATTAITLVIGENPGNASLSPSPARVNAVSGVATFSDVRLNRAGAGYTLVALGSGLASAGTEAFDITPAATTTTIESKVPSGASVVGQSVRVNYEVNVTAPGSGTPSGNVTVSDGTTTCVGTVAAGSCNLVFSSVGDRTLTATYAGSADFGASGSSNVPHTVNRVSTTTRIISDDPDPSAVGEPITVAFTVTANSPGGGTPDGTVTVTISGGDETCSATVAAGSCSITPGTGGNRTITAAYAGNANYAPDENDESHSVRAGTTTAVTSSGSPTVYGQSVSFTATVSATGGGTPTGSVQFKANGSNIGGAVSLSGGSATRTTNSLGVGAYTITADYVPSGGSFAPSSATLAAPHTVNQAGSTTSITGVSPEPSNVGEPYTVSVSVAAAAPGSGTPSGTVTISDGAGQTCEDQLNGAGTASCALSSAAGPKTLTATYNGETRFSTSSGSAPHGVNSPPPAVGDAYSMSAASVSLFVPAPGVLGNDGADPDGDPVSAVLVDNATRGSLLLGADGNLFYTPNPGVTGDSFTYRTTDGRGGSSAPVLVTITVTP